MSTYNTTTTYAPDALPTKHCIDGGPTPIWKRINYTEMLYPPPNSLVTDCHFFAGLDLSPACKSYLCFIFCPFRHLLEAREMFKKLYFPSPYPDNFGTLFGDFCSRDPLEECSSC